MDQGVFNQRLKALSASIAVAILLLIGYAAYRTTTFHVVKTNPSTSNVANTTPFLQVYFSKPITPRGFSASYSDPSLIMSYSITGKLLTFNLSTPSNAGKQYIITINTISDTAGKQLKNIRLSFVPKYVDASSLPADQMAVLLHRQTNPSTKASATFIGNNVLLNDGLSAVQVQAYEQAIRNFAAQHKIKLSAIVINQSGVSPAPLNGSGVFTLSFLVNINDAAYKAKLTYSGATSIELFLYDSKTGAHLFSSGSIGS